MKTYPTTIFPKDVWSQIEFIFWRESVPCLPKGTTGDGIDPISIETTKRGIEISGVIWFLPAGKYDLHLLLSRPAFSSIESVTSEKIGGSIISDSHLVGSALRVIVTDRPTNG